MKNRNALFALTVSLLLTPSSGGIFLIGQQQIPDLFENKSNRGIVSRRTHSLQTNRDFDVPLQGGRQRSWPRRAGFQLRKHLSSAWRQARNFSEASTPVATSVGDNDNTQSISKTGSKLFEFFRLKSSSLFKYYILFRICWWFVEVFNEALSELKEEWNEEAGSSSKRAFSRSSVDKLVAWLEKPEDIRSAPPSSLDPVLLVPLGQELSKCSALPLFEVRRILLQLTNAEAMLLRQCLLAHNEKVDFSEIGGLFRAKKVILDTLRSGMQSMIPSSEPTASLYETMISKMNGRQNILLWGPPGNGKTLLIRAFAKKGFPALVVSPALIQSHERLQIFFSLVSTLGSCQLIMDDLDELFPHRGSGDNSVTTEIQAEMLNRLDALTSHSARISSKNYVTVFAATTCPWAVDSAAWRRFPNRIYIGLPNAEDRYDLLRIYSKAIPPIEKTVLDYFVSVTDGFIPSDIHQILVQACQNGPMVRQDTTLTIEDVQMALSAVVPTRYSAHYVQLLQSYISANSLQGTQQSQQALSSTAQDYFSPRVIQSFPFGENGHCWETALGNYYQLQIPVDSDVLDAIRTILLHTSEWHPGEDWDLSDNDDDDYY